MNSRQSDCGMGDWVWDSDQSPILTRAAPNLYLPAIVDFQSGFPGIWQSEQSLISMHNAAFIIVAADIPDKTMPAVNNAIIAAYRANPVNPIILSKMDIQPTSAWFAVWASPAFWGLPAHKVTVSSSGIGDNLGQFRDL